MLNFLRRACIAVAFAGAAICTAFAQTPGFAGGTWQPLTHQPPANLGECFLLTDGTVLAQQVSSYHWFKLTPDINGSYVNGTWSQVADMRSDYGPLYYASAVLMDGRVVVIGGEYNFNTAAWTNLGAVYDPVANSWTNLAAPAGFTQMGDAQCVVLSDGKFMVADATAFHTAVLDPATMAWSPGSTTGKTETNFDEEGWMLLHDGTILTLDVFTNPTIGEKFVPGLNAWVTAGSTGSLMTGSSYGYEMGPGTVRFDGTVFAEGANGINKLYTPPAISTDPGTWSAAPSFPPTMGADDAPACLLTNGNVLCAADVPLFNNPTHFFEFDGTNLFQVPDDAFAASAPSFIYTMLMLPNGQVMLNSFSNYVQIYTSVGGPQDAWRPTITTYPLAVNP